MHNIQKIPSVAIHKSSQIFVQQTSMEHLLRARLRGSNERRRAKSESGSLLKEMATYVKNSIANTRLTGQREGKKKGSVIHSAWEAEGKHAAEVILELASEERGGVHRGRRAESVPDTAPR